MQKSSSRPRQQKALYSDNEYESTSMERREDEIDAWVIPEHDDLEDPVGCSIREDIKKMQENLPIFEYKKQIIQSVLENDMVVITGETGSGKSTQLPQYIYDSAYIQDKIFSSDSKSDKIMRICVTQPRRVATISMAQRICYERRKVLGKEISYAIRFDDRCSEFTQLRYVTDGIFTIV